MAVFLVVAVRHEVAPLQPLSPDHPVSLPPQLSEAAGQLRCRHWVGVIRASFSTGLDEEGLKEVKLL